MSGTKKIYVAGPMSGYPEFNFPAFMAAADKLRSKGWTVFNPAEKESEKELNAIAYAKGDASLATEHGFDFRECYLWDIAKVIEADAIYMLPNWEASHGAKGEHAVAVAMKQNYPDYQIIYEGEASE